MDDKRGRYYVGPVEQVARERGWFFGRFMDDPLLNTDLVEISWHREIAMTPQPEQRHLHRKTVEVNLVVSGTVTLRINDVTHEIPAGAFYVIWPQTVVSDIATSCGTEVVVVRAPGDSYDKVPLRPPLRDQRGT